MKYTEVKWYHFLNLIFLELTAKKESNCKDIPLLNTHEKKNNNLTLHLLHKSASLSRDTNF